MGSRTRFRLAAGVAFVSLALVACDETRQTTAPDGGIAVSLTAPSLTLARGEGGTLSIAVTRTGSFTGDVSLAIAGLPPGMTAAFSPDRLVGQTLNATVTITVATTVPLASYGVTMRAYGEGSVETTIPFNIIVVAARDYAVNVDPTLLAAQGSEERLSVRVTRTNVDGPITLSLVGAPPGITGTFGAPSASGVSELTLIVAADVATGVYRLTIEARAQGLAARTASLELEIARDVATWRLCEIPSSRETKLLAVQHGVGPWRTIPGSINGRTNTFRFAMDSSFGAVAVVRHDWWDDYYWTEVTYGSDADFNTPRVEACDRGGMTVTGMVAGWSPDLETELWLGGAQGFIIDAGGVARFYEVPLRKVDLLSRRVSLGSAPKALIMRDVALGVGNTLPTGIDFDGPDAFSLVSAPLTVVNATGSNVHVRSALRTVNGEAGFLAGNPGEWFGLPADRSMTGDAYSIHVTAIAPAHSSDTRWAVENVATISAQTITLGPAIAPASMALATGPAPGIRLRGSVPVEYREAIDLSVYSQQYDRWVAMHLTRGFLKAMGFASDYDIVLPNLESLAGFPSDARLRAGKGTVYVRAEGLGSTAGSRRGATIESAVNIP